MVDRFPTSDSQEGSLFGRKACVFAAGYLLLLFAGIVFFGGYGKSDRAHLEALREETAFGDPAVFRIPSAPTANPVLSFEGRPLFIKRLRTFGARDSHMIRAGMDDSKKYLIYRSAEPKVDESEGIFYVKATDSQYLQLSVAPPGSAPHSPG